MDRISLAHKIISGEISNAEFDELSSQINKSEKIHPRTKLREQKKHILFILIVCFENTKIKPKAALADFLSGFIDSNPTEVGRVKKELNDLHKNNNFIFFDDEQYMTLIIVNKQHFSKPNQLALDNFDDETLIIRLDKNKMLDGVYDLSFPTIKPSAIPDGAIISALASDKA